MKLHLLQELLDLNQAFENVARGLERMEKATLFDKEHLRYTRAAVETVRVDANREFFDKFEDIVEKEAKWAYKFRQEHDRTEKDPFDIYLEIKQREEVRRKKGLPPRAVLLPGWDQDDEQRYDEEHAKRRAPGRHQMAARKRSPKSVKTSSPAQTGVARTPERKLDR